MLLGAAFFLMVLCAIWPAALFCLNLRRFCPPPAGQRLFSASVLIPARNEESNIGPALASILLSRDADLEVLVWDDDSTDGTAQIVSEIAALDSRVRLLRGHGLPQGWNGKQHACWQLANAATQPLLVFVDADVRAEPDLIARMAQFREASGAALVSGFPRLITITPLETLLLPLIHFVLLAFLPMRAMRRHLWPSTAAGCGQFLMVERNAYFKAGGHREICATMHDGLLLPRLLRSAGFHTDLADITSLASVRMYDSAKTVWKGLAKNATEGIATPAKIAPLSVLLVTGQVLPPILCALVALCWLRDHTSDVPLAFGLQRSQGEPAPLFWWLLLVALLASYLPRLLAVRRFRQPLRSALLHPLGILLLLCVQWYALICKLMRRPVGWRQRSYQIRPGA